MDTARDLTDRLERNPTLEHQFGLALQALSAHVLPDDGMGQRLVIGGEVVVPGRGVLPRSVGLLASAHDERGRVLGVWKETIDADGFLDMQAFCFSEYLSLPPGEVTTLKLYPFGY